LQLPLVRVPFPIDRRPGRRETIADLLRCGAGLAELANRLELLVQREDFLEKVCRQLHVAAPDRPTTGADNPPGQVAVPSVNVRFAPAKVPQTNFDRKAPMALDELLLQPLIDELD
jgi:hypothetical protein